MPNSDMYDGNDPSPLPDMYMVNGDLSSGSGKPGPPSSIQSRHDSQDLSLFTAAQAAHLRDQWGDLQARFVDDPHDAVSDADRLLTEALDALTSNFAQQKRRLEKSWAAGGDRNTEELRRTLQRYRAFFHQLVDA